MKKTKILIILFCLVIQFSNLVNFSEAFYCRLTYLETDDEIYYFNDEIKINASWELFYNKDIENAYVQIQIFDNFNRIIWNSSKYNKIGSFEEMWVINFNHLNITLTNYSNIFQIKFFNFYFHIDSTNMFSNFLETMNIKIVKRDLMCQLTGFKDNLKFGENLKFVAKFYDNSIESDLNLVNQTISFKTVSNNLIISQHNYTLNKTGMISIFISSYIHLNIGNNDLIFTLANSNIYNNSIFKYAVLIEKSPVLINIIKFEENLTIVQDLEIKLFYYYYFNNTLKPLINQSIQLKIFENETLLYFNEYSTNELGLIYINLTHDFFDFEQKDKDLLFNFIFNGNHFLENNSICLDLKIKKSIKLKNQNILKMNILPIFIVFTLISIILLYAIVKKKKKSAPLSELMIRY